LGHGQQVVGRDDEVLVGREQACAGEQAFTLGETAVIVQRACCKASVAPVESVSELAVPLK
jgi:hypothetical protein